MSCLSLALREVRAPSPAQTPSGATVCLSFPLVLACEGSHKRSHRAGCLPASSAPATGFGHHSRCTVLTPWAGPGQDAQRGPGIHSCPQRLRARFSLESDVGSQEGRAASSSSRCVPSFPEGCVRLPTQCWGAVWTSHQDSSPSILAALSWGGPSTPHLGLPEKCRQGGQQPCAQIGQGGSSGFVGRHETWI